MNFCQEFSKVLLKESNFVVVKEKIEIPKTETAKVSFYDNKFAKVLCSILMSYFSGVYSLLLCWYSQENSFCFYYRSFNEVVLPKCAFHFRCQMMTHCVSWRKHLQKIKSNINCGLNNLKTSQLALL